MKKLIFLLSLAFLFLASCTTTEYAISNMTPEERISASGWNCKTSWIVFKNRTKETIVRWVGDKEIHVKPNVKTVVILEPGKYTVSSGWWESLEVTAYPCWSYTEKIKKW